MFLQTRRALGRWISGKNLAPSRRGERLRSAVKAREPLRQGLSTPGEPRCGSPQARLEGLIAIRRGASFLSPGVVSRSPPVQKDPPGQHLSTRSTGASFPTTDQGLSPYSPQAVHNLPQVAHRNGRVDHKKPTAAPTSLVSAMRKKDFDQQTWAQLANKLGMAVWTAEPMCGQIWGRSELSTFRSSRPQLHPLVIHSRTGTLTSKEGGYPQNPQDLLWLRTPSLFKKKTRQKKGAVDKWTTRSEPRPNCRRTTPDPDAAPAPRALRWRTRGGQHRVRVRGDRRRTRLRSRPGPRSDLGEPVGRSTRSPRDPG